MNPKQPIVYHSITPCDFFAIYAYNLSLRSPLVTTDSIPIAISANGSSFITPSVNSDLAMKRHLPNLASIGKLEHVGKMNQIAPENHRGSTCLNVSIKGFKRFSWFGFRTRSQCRWMFMQQTLLSISNCPTG